MNRQKPTANFLASSMCWSLIITGCSSPGGGDSSNGSPDLDDQKMQAMLQYDDAVTDVQNELEFTIAAVAAYEQAVLANDDVAQDAAISDWEYSSSSLIASLARLEELENTIEARDPQVDGQIVQPLLFVIGAGAVIYGIYKFGSKMKELSDEATEARNRRDEAAEGIMNDVEGAEEAHQEAKNDMQEISEEAVVEVTTKVTSDLITAPMGTGTVGKIVLKHVAGDVLQEGMKVLASTTDCASGSEGECRIATGLTDANGEMEIPAGNVAIVASAPDQTRAVVEEIEVAPDTTTTVTVSPEPIDDASGGTEEDIPTETDTGNGGEQGPSCAELEVCCGNGELDDVPTVLDDCYDAVKKNAELDCSVMLTNLYWACD